MNRMTFNETIDVIALISLQDQNRALLAIIQTVLDYTKQGDMEHAYRLLDIMGGYAAEHDELLEDIMRNLHDMIEVWGKRKSIRLVGS